MFVLYMYYMYVCMYVRLIEYILIYVCMNLELEFLSCVGVDFDSVLRAVS